MDEARVVREQVDAYNARDVERLLSYYSPNVVIADGLGNVMAQGHTAMRGLYAPLFAQSPDLHAEIRGLLHVGGWVITDEVISGINWKGFASELHLLVGYLVEDGKITRSLELR